MTCELASFCSLSSSEQAAWVQAIFSVAAILVAIAIPYCSERSRRKREDLANMRKARSYALVLLDETRSLLNSVVQARIASNDELGDEHLPEINENLNVPQGLKQLAIQLHELGAAGLHLQDAIALVGRAKSEMYTEEVRLRYSGTEHDENGELERLSPIDFSTTLTSARRKLELALEEIQRLFPNM